VQIPCPQVPELERQFDVTVTDLIEPKFINVSPVDRSIYAFGELNYKKYVTMVNWLDDAVNTVAPAIIPPVIIPPPLSPTPDPIFNASPAPSPAILVPAPTIQNIPLPITLCDGPIIKTKLGGGQVSLTVTLQGSVSNDKAKITVSRDIQRNLDAQAGFVLDLIAGPIFKPLAADLIEES
jgi:hypothetical protein